MDSRRELKQQFRLSDEKISAIPPERIHKIDVTKLKQYVAKNKPTSDPVHFKEKKKNEPARQKK